MYMTEVSFTWWFTFLEVWKCTFALVLEVNSSPLVPTCNKHIKDYIEILPTSMFLLKRDLLLLLCAEN